MSTTAGTSPTKRHHIRPAVASDADAVFLLLKQLEETYPVDRTAFNESFASFFAERNAAPSSILLIAEDGGGVVRGFALTTVNRLVHMSGRSAHLQELVVDSAASGQGVGSALVDATEKACRELDVRQLTVASRRSAGFYERLGYRTSADYMKRTFD